MPVAKHHPRGAKARACSSRDVFSRALRAAPVGIQSGRWTRLPLLTSCNRQSDGERGRCNLRLVRDEVHSAPIRSSAAA